MDQQDLPANDESLLTAFAWWEKRRLVYNLIVGCSGLFGIVLFPFFGLITLLGILIYGFMTNVFYTFGFIIEVASKHYFKSKDNLIPRRKTLFIAGLIFSVLMTAGTCIITNLSLISNMD